MSDTNPIRRRYHVSIEAGGDTLKDLTVLLDDLVRGIENGSTTCVHGGPDAGGHFRVVEDPAMTHDRYFELIERRKAADTQTPATGRAATDGDQNDPCPFCVHSAGRDGQTPFPCRHCGGAGRAATDGNQTDGGANGCG